MEDLNVTEHLRELRKRILITFFSFLFAFGVSFFFVPNIYQFLLQDVDGKLALLGPGDILWAYMMMAGVVGVAVTLPIAALQVWKFVSPGMTAREQKASLSYIPGLFFLFLAGLAFGYFVLFPLVLSFLESLAGSQFETFFTVQKYFSFMMNLTLPFGFLFEMPAIIMFLTRLGILQPNQLMKKRKYSYFGLIVLSVLITPPDFMSDVLVIVPLLFLYECSIGLSVIVYKKHYAAGNEM
ncbi:twin-arginine translocase subunit TatC [Salibacterium aidingense]|uniref:twin-arginine translocase subunit TatC n=1 Tax=Salibacterium aidingense TaxID=384933 RepID=UPI0004203222|nr:twin-arginine translocase subunit TatC [Salibacterium aidingense]